jgi:hypothetical protein
MSTPCGFGIAWSGKCKSPAIFDSGRCGEHAAKVCISCGATATHQCEETGQFICGYDLCDDCEHTIFESGTNGGIGFCAEAPPKGMQRHCKKTEQRFKPWYAHKEEEV